MAKHNIVKDLESLAYPIEKLETLPGNPRQGNVQSVANSLEKFGQRKPIVARKKPDSDIGVVLAGNTTLKGARKLDWEKIAVTWVEDDDKTAAAFAIADNRTHDLGQYDEQKVVDMIAQFDDDDTLLEASGYDLMDVEEMTQSLEDFDGDIDLSEFEESDGMPDEQPDRPPSRPVVQYALVFDDEDQQQRWYSFVRWLKRTFPDSDTVAGRIDEYLQDAMDD